MVGGLLVGFGSGGLIVGVKVVTEVAVAVCVFGQEL